jgi:hypothetical protein
MLYSFVFRSELCSDTLDTALQAMALCADSVVVASCNGIMMATKEYGNLSSIELCLYLFGKPSLNLDGTAVILFPILAG